MRGHHLRGELQPEAEAHRAALGERREIGHPRIRREARQAARPIADRHFRVHVAHVQPDLDARALPRRLHRIVDQILQRTGDEHARAAQPQRRGVVEP
ncbi:Uncharacterised protein [Burkholderia pseudomallei]|nr:Uncharacterised protein [Burkholderia pseudomallei]